VGRVPAHRGKPTGTGGNVPDVLLKFQCFIPAGASHILASSLC